MAGVLKKIETSTGVSKTTVAVAGGSVAILLLGGIVITRRRRIRKQRKFVFTEGDRAEVGQGVPFIIRLPRPSGASGVHGGLNGFDMLGDDDMLVPLSTSHIGDASDIAFQAKTQQLPYTLDIMIVPLGTTDGHRLSIVASPLAVRA